MRGGWPDQLRGGGYQVPTIRPADILRCLEDLKHDNTCKVRWGNTKNTRSYHLINQERWRKGRGAACHGTNLPSHPKALNMETNPNIKLVYWFYNPRTQADSVPEERKV